MLLPRFSGLIWHHMLNVWHKSIERHFETHSEVLWITTCTVCDFSQRKHRYKWDYLYPLMICNDLFNSLLWYSRSAAWFTWLLSHILRLCPYQNKNYLQQPFLNLMRQNHLRYSKPRRFYSNSTYHVRLQSQLVSRTYVISAPLPVSARVGDPLED